MHNMFTQSEKTKILKLKSSIASYYDMQMKKIGNSALQSLFYSNCVISGGCISSLFHNEPVNDIDLYAKSTSAMTNIKEFILAVDKINKIIKTSEAYNVTPAIQLITANAVTLINDVQFIYMDKWDNMKPTFDFIHCMPHYDLSTQQLFISKKQYDSIASKKIIANSEFIKEFRLEKYSKKGWEVPNVKKSDDDVFY